MSNCTQNIFFSSTRFQIQLDDKVLVPTTDVFYKNVVHHPKIRSVFRVQDAVVVIEELGKERIFLLNDIKKKIQGQRIKLKNKYYEFERGVFLTFLGFE
jgi:hypothetical protein